MIRNALLLVGTTAILAVGFLGYYSVTRIDRDGGVARDTVVDKLDKKAHFADDEKILIPVPGGGGTASLSPGEGAEWTEFDDFTGRPRRRFRYSKWTKVAGTRNDLEVEDPSITLYMPGNTTVEISADRGVLSSDKLDTRKFQPKKGLLEGNVRLTIDGAGSSSSKLGLLGGLVVELDRLRFDLELGEIVTDGKLLVLGDGFQIRGRGLSMIWNEAEKRIDKLDVQQGELLEIALSGAMFGGLNDSGSPRTEDAESSEPAQPRERRVTTYACTLVGAVEASLYKGQDRTQSLTAPELHLLFEVGDGARNAMRPDRELDQAVPQATSASASQPMAGSTSRSASAPASQPTSQPAPERLVVHWNGPLALIPTGTRVTSDPLRREIEARGGDVRVDLGDETVECGRLVYHGQDRRLWIYGRNGAPVDLKTSELTASASSIFFDRDASIVKLIGNVSLLDVSGSGRIGSSGLGIHCDLWAELHLAAKDEGEDESRGIGEELGKASQLESAVFVGNVRVELSDQTLRSHRLEARFRAAPIAAAEQNPATHVSPKAPDVVLAEAESPSVDDGDPSSSRPELESAVASGNVRLTSKGQRLRCTWMQVHFVQDDTDKPVPSRMVARGAVRLDDPDSRVFARGRQMIADMSRDGQVERAEIIGDAGRPAAAQAQDYVIRSKRIDLELGQATDDPRGNLPFHLHMPGESTLVFTSDRGLQGQRRRSAARITVTCTENMAFDSDVDTNEVNFVGNVVVRDGDDRIEAQRLTLYLEDQPADAKNTGLGSRGDWIRSMPDTVRWAMRVPGTARDTWRAMQDAKRKALGQPPRLTGASRIPRQRIRKQPLRLVAHQAALISETYDPGRNRPIVMQQIDAPELIVEIPQRTVRTLGETTLGMTSLRLGGGEAEELDVLGLPSAMITKGPSQTAMSAGRSMTYVFAEDGPDRRDSVLFEGGVKFVHVAGKRVKYLHELIPELNNNPAARDQLKDSVTRLDCDSVELLLDVVQTADGRQRSPRMTWMNARGDVYLVDQQGADHRAVTAGQIEFDRAEQTVRVLGDKVMNQLAKIETWNPETNAYDVPATGMAMIIHLDTNTIKADRISGQMRR